MGDLSDEAKDALAQIRGENAREEIGQNLAALEKEEGEEREERGPWFWVCLVFLVVLFFAVLAGPLLDYVVERHERAKFKAWKKILKEEVGEELEKLGGRTPYPGARPGGR